MSRLIDADAVIDAFEKLCDRVCVYSKKQRWAMCGACQLANAFDVIDNMPTVDAVEVIRCGHCKYQDKGENESGSWNCCSIGYCDVEDDYFCWWAERRQDE